MHSDSGFSSPSSSQSSSLQKEALFSHSFRLFEVPGKGLTGITWNVAGNTSDPTHKEKILELLVSWGTKPQNGRRIDFIMLQEFPAGYQASLEEKLKDRGPKNDRRLGYEGYNWYQITATSESGKPVNIILYRGKILKLQPFEGVLDGHLQNYAKHIHCQVFSIEKWRGFQKSFITLVSAHYPSGSVLVGETLTSCASACRGKNGVRTPVVIAGHFGAPLSVERKSDEEKTGIVRFHQHTGAVIINRNEHPQVLPTTPIESTGELRRIIKAVDFASHENSSMPEFTAEVQGLDPYAGANTAIQQYLNDSSCRSRATVAECEVRSARIGGEDKVAILFPQGKANHEFKEAKEIKTEKRSEGEGESKVTYDVYYLSRTLIEIPELRAGMLKNHYSAWNDIFFLYVLEVIPLTLVGSFCFISWIFVLGNHVTEQESCLDYWRLTTVNFYLFIAAVILSHGIVSKYKKAKEIYDFTELQLSSIGKSPVIAVITVLFFLVVNLSISPSRFAPFGMQLLDTPEENIFAGVLNGTITLYFLGKLAYFLYENYPCSNTLDYWCCCFMEPVVAKVSDEQRRAMETTVDDWSDLSPRS